MNKLRFLLVCAALMSFSKPACAAESNTDSNRNTVALEALSRLKGMDLEANPAIKAAVLKVLESFRGTPQFVEIVRDFNIKDQNAALLDYAINNSTNTAGVDAARLVLENEGIDLFKKSLDSENAETAAKTAEVLGNTNEKKVVPLLESIVSDKTRPYEIRTRGVHALVQTQEGASALVGLARAQKLPDDLKKTASAELQNVRWPKIKSAAAEILPPAPLQEAGTLPPVAELVKLKGDSARGGLVFSRQTVGCNNCHQVNGEGIDFGPKLSEIGTKLGKDALYASILDPSAGIAFGYEAWQLELKDGDEAFGLIVSETADEISVKTQNGIVTRYKKADVAKREKMTTSIMPAGLEQAMSQQDLIDLVEYLASLKKSEGGK